MTAILMTAILKPFEKFLVHPPVAVGSRVTCDPPVMNTDEDYLLHVREDAWEDFCLELIAQGWGSGGSDIPDTEDITPIEDRFKAYRLGVVNLIVTRSPVFYQRFLAASTVALRLNLLNKGDRIMLFQAVLYGKFKRSQDNDRNLSD